MWRVLGVVLAVLGIAGALYDALARHIERNL